ncbi:RING-type and ankyrin repeat protein [uncultured virus]|nr:RING-type and ankyrin repeat protein [uncultured virus]
MEWSNTSILRQTSEGETEEILDSEEFEQDEIDYSVPNISTNQNVGSNNRDSNLRRRSYGYLSRSTSPVREYPWQSSPHIMPIIDTSNPVDYRSGFRPSFGTSGRTSRVTKKYDNSYEKQPKNRKAYKHKYNSLIFLNDSTIDDKNINTLTNKIFPNKIPKPLQIVSLDHNPINEHNHNNWFLPDDFGENFQIQLDEEMMVNAQITSLSEQALAIMNLGIIQEEEKDEKFINYLLGISNGLNYIINIMMENHVWRFDPLEKITWMYLFLACKYESRAIKYIINSPYYNKNLLRKKDKYLLTPLLVSFFTNSDEMIKEIHKYFEITIELLLEEHLNIPLIFHSINNTEIFNYFQQNIPNINNILFEKFNNTTIFLIACQSNPEIANIILNSEMMTQEFFQIEMNDFNCLMLSAFHQPNFLENLLNSKFCNQKMVDINLPLFGTILNVLVKFHPDQINILLNSKYMSKFLFDAQKTNKNYRINILFDSLDNEVILNKLINNEFVNENLLTNYCSFIKETLFFDLIRRNDRSTINHILNLPFVTSNILKSTNERDQNVLHYAAIKNINIFLDLFKCKHFETKMLNEPSKSDNGKNILMLILQNNELNKITEELVDLLKPYINYDLLKYQDSNGFNTFTYLCKYLPYLASFAIEKNLIDDKILLEPISKDSYQLFAIFCMTDDKILLKILLDSNYFNEKYFDLEDSSGNNLALEVSKYMVNNLSLFFNSDYFKKNNIKKKNKKDENILINILDCPNETDENILNFLLNNENFPELLSSKNNLDESCFLIACKTHPKIALKILESPFFDNKLLKQFNDSGSNCFREACIKCDYNLIKAIGENEIFSKELFEFFDSNTLSIEYALQSNDIQIWEYILNHKFMNIELLTKCILDMDTQKDITSDSKILNVLLNCKNIENVILTNLSTGKNLLMYALINLQYDIVYQILEKFKNLDLISGIDSDGSNLLHYIYEPNLLKKILESDWFNPKSIFLLNNNNCSLIHHYIGGDHIDLAKIIIEKYKCPKDLLKTTTNNGLNLIVEMEIYDLTDLLMDLIESEDLLVTNYSNETCLHKIFGTQDLTKSKNLLSKLIKNKKLNSKLMEKKNINGDTFLMVGSELIDETIIMTILELIECSNEFLECINNKGENILTLLCSNNEDLVPLLVEHKKATKNLLIYDNILCPLFYLINSNKINLFDYIITLDICDDTIINYAVNKFITPLYYSILLNRENILNKLLSLKFDLNPSFNLKDNIGRNILQFSITAPLTKIGAYKSILASKYINNNHLLDYNIHKENFYSSLFNLDIEFIKYFIESKYWNDKIMFERFNNNEFLLGYIADKPEILNYLIFENKCNQSMMKIKNKNGMNCCHIYSMKNQKSLEILLNSNMCTMEIINEKDNFGRTCLHIACEYNKTCANLLLTSKFNNKLLLNIKNNKGLNALMIAIKCNQEIANQIIESEHFDLNQMTNCDYKGNNVIMYAIKYHPTLLKKLMESKYFDIKLLQNKNINNDSCYLYSCKHNGYLIQDLLEKYINQELLYYGDSENGSCLTLGARYQPQAIRYLLSDKIISPDILNLRYKNQNFMEIGCIYNSETIKYALESNVDLSYFFETNELMFLAVKFQPQAVKYILESKYGNSSMLQVKKNSRTCIDEAFDFQPKSLYFLINSKFGTNEILNKEDETGYRLLHKIKKNYPDIKSLKDIKNINLVDHENSIANENEPNICNICYNYKMKVVFGPCCHTSCIGCAFKLHQCHQCREQIISKNVVFNYTDSN